jgi:RHS repeat-associated protein
VLRRYVPGADEDEPVIWYEGSGFTDRRWLHADNQGSIIAYSTDAGSALTIYGYDAYGVPNAWAGSRYRYTGQTEIPEAQLYYYKARVYDPTLGRFLQTDPVGYKDDADLYAYVGDDPIDRADPTGNNAIVIGAEIGCVADAETACVPGAVIGGVVGGIVWIGAAACAEWCGAVVHHSDTPTPPPPSRVLEVP